MTAFEMQIDGEPVKAARDAVLLHHIAPPVPVVAPQLEEPLTTFLWADPGGNYTGQMLLAVAVDAEQARELIVADAAELDPTTLEAYRAFRRNERRALGAYRNLWSQLQADPQRLTRPTALRLRPLFSPGTAHS